jgi:hypothetical protein
MILSRQDLQSIRTKWMQPHPLRPGIAAGSQIPMVVSHIK